MRDQATNLELTDTVRVRTTSGRRRSRWPLPVALVLAIVYWFYLNSQVFRSDYADLDLRVVQSTESLTTNGLDIRLPRNDLIVTRIALSKGGKVFDPKEDRIRVKVRAPGASLKQLGTSTVIVADVPDDVVEDCRANGSAVFELDIDDLKDANGELTPYLQEMQPARLYVSLGRSLTHPVDLRWDLVKIKFPEGTNWDSRIFARQIRFVPDSMDLEGPDKLIRSTSRMQAIFLLDLTEKLSEIREDATGDRLDVTEILQIAPELAEKGVRSLQSVKATVQFAPAPTVFDDLEIGIEADWKGSPLSKTEFRVDKTVKFELRTYDSNLSTMLRDSARRKRWIEDNLRCFVRPSELDATLDTSKEDFVAHLTPHFFLYDDNFTLGRELKIQQKSLISFSRKSP